MTMQIEKPLICEQHTRTLRIVPLQRFYVSLDLGFFTLLLLAVTSNRLPPHTFARIPITVICWAVSKLNPAMSRQQVQIASHRSRPPLGAWPRCGHPSTTCVLSRTFKLTAQIVAVHFHCFCRVSRLQTRLDCAFHERLDVKRSDGQYVDK